MKSKATVKSARICSKDPKISYPGAMKLVLDEGRCCFLAALFCAVLALARFQDDLRLAALQAFATVPVLFLCSRRRRGRQPSRRLRLGLVCALIGTSLTSLSGAFPGLWALGILLLLSALREPATEARVQA
ncbi:MAG: hypothetical protein CMJ87_05350 [Planctomycetes bacterium]|nr:hypothetical protein [Planctomycetota bacterium]